MTSDSSKGCVFKVHLEYLKELCEAPDKIEVKKKRCLTIPKIDAICLLLIGNVKKLVTNYFDKEKCVL